MLLSNTASLPKPDLSFCQATFNVLCLFNHDNLPNLNLDPNPNPNPKVPEIVPRITSAALFSPGSASSNPNPNPSSNPNPNFFVSHVHLPDPNFVPQAARSSPPGFPTLLRLPSQQQSMIGFRLDPNLALN